MGITEYIGLFLLGLFVGGFGTLIGAGGGFILVPVLLLMYPKLPPELITSISLAVVFLNATSGSVSYARMGRIDYKSAFIFIIATMPGAIIGANLTSRVPRDTFNMFLGGMLIIISLYLMLRPEKMADKSGVKKHGFTRSVTDKQGRTYTYTYNLPLGIAISFFVGFLSSMLGIGGGIIHVPAMTNLLGFPIHLATATSHFIPASAIKASIK